MEARLRASEIITYFRDPLNKSNSDFDSSETTAFIDPRNKTDPNSTRNQQAGYWTAKSVVKASTHRRQGDPM